MPDEAPATAPVSEAAEEAAAQELLARWTAEESSEPEPAPADQEPLDRERYEALVAKLRDEVKAVKADRTPQDEKDAKTIAALRRQLENTKSPEDVKKEFAQAIGKALGLVKDEPVDPAELTKQLTQAQSEQRQAALELAVFRAAPDSVSANALLDSRSFLAKVADLNPSDSDAIKAAVGAAVQANPALGQRIPAPNPAQGSSGSGPATPGQLTRADLARMTPEQINKARAEGRLTQLLGIDS